MDYNDIVFIGMFGKDAFSKWLGIEIVALSSGSCTLTMEVRSEMTNGFGIAHGGITYSLADSALAFASNSRGRHAVSIETSISHIKAVYPGMKLTAIAKEVSRSNRIGQYDIVVNNEQGETMAWFRGTVFVKDTLWKETDLLPNKE